MSKTPKHEILPLNNFQIYKIAKWLDDNSTDKKLMIKLQNDFRVNLDDYKQLTKEQLLKLKAGDRLLNNRGDLLIVLSTKILPRLKITDKEMRTVIKLKVSMFNLSHNSKLTMSVNDSTRIDGTKITYSSGSSYAHRYYKLFK